jgi:UPF0716 family protein affecting phage T7 exclusion
LRALSTSIFIIGGSGLVLPGILDALGLSLLVLYSYQCIAKVFWCYSQRRD